MDMVEILVALLRAGIIKVKIEVDLPNDFVSKLQAMLIDKKLDGPELADLIDAFRGK